MALAYKKLVEAKLVSADRAKYIAMSIAIVARTSRDEELRSLVSSSVQKRVEAAIAALTDVSSIAKAENELHFLVHLTKFQAISAHPAASLLFRAARRGSTRSAPQAPLLIFLLRGIGWFLRGLDATSPRLDAALAEAKKIIGLAPPLDAQLAQALQLLALPPPPTAAAAPPPLEFFEHLLERLGPAPPDPLIRCALRLNLGAEAPKLAAIILRKAASMSVEQLGQLARVVRALGRHNPSLALAVADAAHAALARALKAPTAKQRLVALGWFVAAMFRQGITVQLDMLRMLETAFDSPAASTSGETSAEFLVSFVAGTLREIGDKLLLDFPLLRFLWRFMLFISQRENLSALTEFLVVEVLGLLLPEPRYIKAHSDPSSHIRTLQESERLLKSQSEKAAFEFLSRELGKLEPLWDIQLPKKLQVDEEEVQKVASEKEELKAVKEAQEVNDELSRRLSEEMEVAQREGVRKVKKVVPIKTESDGRKMVILQKGKMVVKIKDVDDQLALAFGK